MRKFIVVGFYYIIAVMLFVLLIVLTPSLIENYIDFEKNYIGVECTLVDFEVERTHKRRRGFVNEYRYIYLYIDENNVEHKVTPYFLVEKELKIGQVNTIYLNPDNPTNYYTNSKEALLSLLFMPPVLLLASYCTAKQGKKKITS